MYYFTKHYELSYYHAQFKTLIHWYDIIMLIVKGLVDELSYWGKKDYSQERTLLLKSSSYPSFPKALPILLRV